MHGGARGISRRGMTLPMRGLKYSFHGTTKGKNHRKNSLFQRGATAFLALPSATPSEMHGWFEHKRDE